MPGAGDGGEPLIGTVYSGPYAPDYYGLGGDEVYTEGDYSGAADQVSTVLNASTVGTLGTLAASLGSTINGVINGLRYGYLPQTGTLASGVKASPLSTTGSTSMLLLLAGLGLLLYLFHKKG